MVIYDDRRDICGVFHKWGTPKWIVYKGKSWKSYLEMDENWGYPYDETETSKCSMEFESKLKIAFGIPPWIENARMGYSCAKFFWGHRRGAHAGPW